MINYSREEHECREQAEEDYWNEKSKLPERWELEDEPQEDDEEEIFDNENDLFKPGD